MNRCRLATLLWLTALLSVGWPAAAAPPDSTAKKPVTTGEREPPREVQVRGRVVCIPEELHRRFGAELPTKHEHLWGLRTAEGTLYTLLRGKYSEAIFIDERVRAKELLLKARVFPKSQVLEVAAIRSMRDGVVQDLHYYCDVCAIESVSPEPCACCQGPVELVEEPLAKGNHP
jgi:hypothetical protein